VIERLALATPLTYAVRGKGPVSRRSQELRARLKRADPVLLPQIAGYVKGLADAGAFQDFFDGAVLVPVPGSTPLAPGAVGRGVSICNALRAAGLGTEVRELVERAVPVQKSAFAAPAERPTAAEHLASMRAAATLDVPARVLLVDDVVTRGATLLAAASCLATAFPTLEVRGFALLRTQSQGEITTMRDPQLGHVELAENGQTYRRP
jgi:hypothetical protein